MVTPQVDFNPRGWRLPKEASAFDDVLVANKRRKKRRRDTFIVKPSQGSEGNGIFLVQTPADMPRHVLDRRNGWVAQVRDYESHLIKISTRASPSHTSH